VSLASKTFFALVAVFTAIGQSLHAQTEKGQYLIGGSADISEIFQNNVTTFNFSIQPSFGVFVVKGFAIGGVYGFSCGSSKTYNPTNKNYTTATTFNTKVGPNLKYYLGKKEIKGFAAINPAYTVYTQMRSTSGESGTGITNYDGFSLTGSVGVAYFFNQHISLETAGYITASGYQKQLPTTRIGLSLGLYAFLDKKKQE
jgi:outer membrane protein with beta-barrel domain